VRHDAETNCSVSRQRFLPAPSVPRERPQEIIAGEISAFGRSKDAKTQQSRRTTPTIECNRVGGFCF
jgi:hypothetical protein